MSVVVITGENDFARTQAVRELVDTFVLEHGGLALERLDGEEHEFSRIQESLTSLPFLANKKMVLFNRPSGSSQFADKAEALLQELPETTELVIVERKFDKRSNLYKVLKKETDMRELGNLDVPQLAKWLVTVAAEKNAKLSLGDARYLVERVGPIQQLLAGELDKLMLFNPVITRQTIDELTDKTPQSTIFELIESALAGNRQKALELYDEQRRLKVEPIQIIAMFAWQLHVLALVCASDGRTAEAIAREAKMSPFTVSKAQRLAAKASLAEVKQLVDRLVILDGRSKRESIDLDEALRNYITQLH